jgi:hypothetical protein
MAFAGESIQNAVFLSGACGSYSEAHAESKDP